jgi:hypothetical protein
VTENGPLDSLRLDPGAFNFVEEFCTRVLASLPRSDQRRWGLVYIRGLLAASGRKTMRGIAATADGVAVEQSLQQFVSKSTWEYEPVRKSLALHIERNFRPLGWVAHHLVIPKAGSHSVGVERQFVTPPGRLTNCQRAIGLWMAGEHGSVPVEWNIILPRRWTQNEQLRRRAEIPEFVGTDSSMDSESLRAIREVFYQWKINGLPIVLPNSQNTENIIGALTGFNVPYILRVGSSFPLMVKDSVTSYAVRRMTALRAVEFLGDRRKHVEWHDYKTSMRRVSIVVSASVYVHLSASVGTADRNPSPLTLLSVRNGFDREPEYWISNIRSSSIEFLVALTRLPLRVARDLQDVEELGIKDFEGRSFRGWHHHSTLVSVAHAIRLMSNCGAIDFEDDRRVNLNRSGSLRYGY